MKQSKKTILILSVLAAALLAYFYFSEDERHYNWMETYRANSAEPYGTLFIRKMLETYRDHGDFMVNDQKSLKAFLEEVPEPENTDYVFIGERMFLDEASVGALADFLDAGGNAFIASVDPPDALLDAVYYRECGASLDYMEATEDSVRLNFFSDGLRTKSGYEYRYRMVDREYPYPWKYVSDSVLCEATESVVPLGYQQDEKVNFVMIPAGKGHLYLHTTPLVFTNYFMVSRGNLDYVSGVFSHLSGKDMVWDESGKLFLGNTNSFNGPLYYILQQPALKYAWWMLLLAVILYIAFASKRRQRIIPVLEPKTNTSLEFVKLVARLHYKNGDHLDMARKKMKYFLYFVRSRYGIHAEKFGDDQIRRLAGKARVRQEDVAIIFSRYSLIDQKFRDDIEVNRLVDLYEAIEHFYRQCK